MVLDHKTSTHWKSEWVFHYYLALAHKLVIISSQLHLAQFECMVFLSMAHLNFGIPSLAWLSSIYCHIKIQEENNNNSKVFVLQLLRGPVIVIHQNLQHSHLFNISWLFMFYAPALHLMDYWANKGSIYLMCASYMGPAKIPL